MPGRPNRARAEGEKTGPDSNSSSKKKAGWAKALCWLGGASSFFYVLSRFLPCTPPDEYPNLDNIDIAWTQALHMAFHQHLQFGREVVFTYGPWGFISRGYHPSTHLVSLLLWVGLSVVFWVAGRRLAGHFSSNRVISWLWLIAFAAFASIPVGDDFNSRIVAWSMLLLFMHFFVEESSFTPVKFVLVISLGLLSLTKFTGFIAAMVVILVMAVDDLSRRRFPWSLPVFVASILCFWVAAGQNWSSFMPYLTNSWRLTSGYTEAMMRYRVGEKSDELWFLLLAIANARLIGAVAWGRFRLRCGLVLISLAAILFLLFKGSYVRPDRHEISAANGLVLVALAGLAVAWREKSRWLGFAGAAVLVACVIFGLLAFNQWFPKNNLPCQLAATFGFHSLSAPIRTTFTDSLQKHFEADAIAERERLPLPQVSGGTDIYPWDVTPILARDMNYHPRPLMQSYFVYTPELAQINAAFLKSSNAPENLFFGINPIDGRYPALEDGRSWLELLTSYDVRGISDSNATLLVLARSVTPREYHLEPLTNVAAQFGEMVAVPDAGGDPVWVELDIKKSLKGTIVSALYKPSFVLLTVSLRGGSENVFRIIPGMARSGFLLSPFIGNNVSFAALASKDLQRSLAGLEVATMSVSVDASSGSSSDYRTPVQIRFYRLNY
ncbi:MAG TPA: hypothetical protein VNX46_05705 [Candidatus Acidoferrum sp.]|nr:hypothetical protein [Candidatus Acidoferrum sp.]